MFCHYAELLTPVCPILLFVSQDVTVKDQSFIVMRDREYVTTSSICKVGKAELIESHGDFGELSDGHPCCSGPLSPIECLLSLDGAHRSLQGLSGCSPTQSSAGRSQASLTVTLIP